MAINNSMWLKGAIKKLGGTVLYQQAGRTLQRELAPHVANPRTPPQMSNRVKWANLVTFYRANRGWIHKAFEVKKRTQSDYNKLMQLNVTNSTIYLTKQEVEGGACVISPYRISDGTLPSISLELTGEQYQSDIDLGTLAINEQTTTVADFATAVLSNNMSVEAGDQLSIIVEYQMINKESGYPYVVVREWEILLDEDDDSLLSDHYQSIILDSVNIDGHNKLAIAYAGSNIAFALIWSRTKSGKTYVSPQSLVMDPNNNLYIRYSSVEQLQRAMDSYNIGEEVFLDTNDTAYQTETNKGIIATGYAIGANEYDWTNHAPYTTELTKSDLVIKFNKNVIGKRSKLRLSLSDNTAFNVAGGVIVNNNIVYNKTLFANIAASKTIMTMQITLEGAILIQTPRNTTSTDTTTYGSNQDDVTTTNDVTTTSKSRSK